MITTKPTAVAWSLRAKSASGYKRYSILVFDRYVIVGWGAVTGTTQYQFHDCGSTVAARAFALSQTEAKETKGYVMRRMPTASNMPAADWASLLPSWAKHRGASPTLDLAFKTLFLEGTSLGS